MEQARVALFEDDEYLREDLELYITRLFGHQVIYSIATMEQARQVIEGMDPGTLDAAVIDGNLSSGHTGEDGREIVRRLHERDPQIATIAFSGAGDIDGAKHQVGKGNLSGLEKVLKEL